MARLGNGDRPARRFGRRAVLRLALLAACLMPLPLAAAETSAASAAVTEPIAELNAGLLAQMKAGPAVPFATRYAQLAPLIERVFDLPVILRASVGPRWTALGPEEQTQLLDAFRSYTVSSYAANFSDYGGQRFVILPDTRSVGAKIIVATQIVSPSGAPARLDYVLDPRQIQGGVRWKAVDVMLDGSISQIALQRSEFHGLLGDGNAAKLIATLQRKSSDLSGAAARPAATTATPGTAR